MDILKAEMEKKRKALEELGKGGQKHIKRSELENLREQKYLQEQRELEEKRRKKEEERLLQLHQKERERKEGPSSKKPAQNGSSSSLPASSSSAPSDPSASSTSSSSSSAASAASSSLSSSSSSTAAPEAQTALAIPAKEVIKRLRRRGEPIRLFGETDEGRILRLKRLEEADGDISEGQRNDFMKNITQHEKELELETLIKKGGGGEGEAQLASVMAEKEKERPAPALLPITLELFRKQKDKCYMAIHDYFNKLLGDWEEALNARPDEEKRTYKGKSDSAIHKQSEEYLQPLFKLLQKKQLPDDIMENIVKICQLMQERKYVDANDIYYLLSIGNAPWPIGVTMVGIHERSAREKISSNQVAHVLNDEKTRKWIQSMKRLMTFCQRRYPPEDLSQTIGWIKE